MAIERNKFKTEAYKVRGFARQNLGLDSLAIEDYNIGLQYNPIDKYFFFYKAVAQTEVKTSMVRTQHLLCLLRQYPKFEEGFTARGRLNPERGDTTAAVEDIDKALALSKSMLNPYLLKAEIEWKRKNWRQAGEAMDATIRLSPDLPGFISTELSSGIIPTISSEL